MYLYVVMYTVLFCVVLLIYGFERGYEFHYVTSLFVVSYGSYEREVHYISLLKIEITYIFIVLKFRYTYLVYLKKGKTSKNTWTNGL